MNKKEQEQQQKLVIQQQQLVSSPLPPPEWMERFVKIYPDAAKDIFEDFKKVSEANRKVLLENIENNKKQLKIIAISQWHGFIATLVILFAAILFGYLGKEKICLAFLGLSFVGIIQALIRKN